MRKSTKGAAAALAAVALLLGGFGTHAAWTDNNTFLGGDIKDGSLKLTGTGCDPWRLFADTADATTGAVEDVLASGSLSGLYLLPGQVLTRHCSFTVDVKGVGSVRATVNAPSLSSLTGGLSPDAAGGLSLATVLKKNATTLTVDPADGASTSVADGDVISADFTATLASGALQSVWQDVSGTLNTLTVTVATA